MAEYTKIPKDRVGVLVGRGGETKAMIESRGRVKLDISSEGSVSITSLEENGLAEWKTLDVVKAVGRGFNPRYAMNLFKEDYSLSIINLFEVLNRKEADLKRVKARIIGEEGKAWRTIELLTNTKLCVYGRTVAIIGHAEDVEIVERAIQMIINGSQHPAVYQFLEKQCKNKRASF